MFLRKKKDRFFWNGFTKSVNITFLKTGLVAATQIKLVLKGSKTLSSQQIYVSIVLMAALTFITLGYFIFLKRSDTEELEKEETIDRLGYIYNDIHLKRSSYGKYFQAVFLFR